MHQKVYQIFPDCCKLGLAVGCKAVQAQGEEKLYLFYQALEDAEINAKEVFFF